MNIHDWQALAHSLSKDRGCLIDLAQGCRYPGVPPHLEGWPYPWFRCKVLVDLQRFSSIALHARYDSERSDMPAPAEWAVSPLRNGLFKHYAGFVDSAAELVRDVMRELAEFSGVNPQSDDITALALRTVNVAS